MGIIDNLKAKVARKPRKSDTTSESVAALAGLALAHPERITDAEVRILAGSALNQRERPEENAPPAPKTAPPAR